MKLVEDVYELAESFIRKSSHVKLYETRISQTAERMIEESTSKSHSRLQFLVYGLAEYTVNASV